MPIKGQKGIQQHQNRNIGIDSSGEKQCSVTITVGSDGTQFDTMLNGQTSVVFFLAEPVLADLLEPAPLGLPPPLRLLLALFEEAFLVSLCNSGFSEALCGSPFTSGPDFASWSWTESQVESKLAVAAAA